MLMLLASTSLLVIAIGAFCLYDTDTAWRMYTWDCHSSGMPVPPWRNWRLRVQQAGSSLVALGIIGLMVSFG